MSNNAEQYGNEVYGSSVYGGGIVVSESGSASTTHNIPSTETTAIAAERIDTSGTLFTAGSETASTSARATATGFFVGNLLEAADSAFSETATLALNASFRQTNNEVGFATESGRVTQTRTVSGADFSRSTETPETTGVTTINPLTESTLAVGGATQSTALLTSSDEWSIATDSATQQTTHTTTARDSGLGTTGGLVTGIFSDDVGDTTTTISERLSVVFGQDLRAFNTTVADGNPTTITKSHTIALPETTTAFESPSRTTQVTYTPGDTASSVETADVGVTATPLIRPVAIALEGGVVTQTCTVSGADRGIASPAPTITIGTIQYEDDWADANGSARATLPPTYRILDTTNSVETGSVQSVGTVLVRPLAVATETGLVTQTRRVSGGGDTGRAFESPSPVFPPTYSSEEFSLSRASAGATLPQLFRSGDRSIGRETGSQQTAGDIGPARTFGRGIELLSSLFGPQYASDETGTAREQSTQRVAVTTFTTISADGVLQARLTTLFGTDQRIDDTSNATESGTTVGPSVFTTRFVGLTTDQPRVTQTVVPSVLDTGRVSYAQTLTSDINPWTTDTAGAVESGTVTNQRRTRASESGSGVDSASATFPQLFTPGETTTAFDGASQTAQGIPVVIPQSIASERPSTLDSLRVWTTDTTEAIELPSVTYPVQSGFATGEDTTAFERGRSVTPALISLTSGIPALRRMIAIDNALSDIVGVNQRRVRFEDVRNRNRDVEITTDDRNVSLEDDGDGDNDIINPSVSETVE